MMSPFVWRLCKGKGVGLKIRGEDFALRERILEGFIMADKDGYKVAKDYHTDVPFANQNGFYVKGANALDWGMKKHLANIFDEKSGNTVMFAFDHGYFMGSVAGLERLDLLLPQLMPSVDVLMCTRGALRTSVPPMGNTAIALRVPRDPLCLTTIFRTRWWRLILKMLFAAMRTAWPCRDLSGPMASFRALTICRR